MTNSPTRTETSTTPQETPLGPGRCLVGALIAGAIAFGCYEMTAAIASTFAAKPITSDNFTVQRIAAAVRTLVVGITSLGTGVFGLATFGLLGLAIQLAVRGGKTTAPPPGESK